MTDAVSQSDDRSLKPPTSRSTALVVLALRLLATQNPTVAEELNNCRAQIQSKYQRRTDDEGKILRALGQGYHVPSEISQATRIPLKTVHKRLAELMEREIVYRSRQSAASGRGGDRRGYLYWLT